jgi:nitrite reductase/ring-hydroxylating ferredoxin subunit/uncharacterized membrane protein
MAAAQGDGRRPGRVIKGGTWGIATGMSRPGRSRRQLTPLEPLVRGLESAGKLDAPGNVVGRLVRGLIPAGRVKEAVSGTWLGHALHPLLTDVVIGSFVSATLLDVIGGEDAGPASERLIAVGVLSYGPTALTGVSDYADSEAYNAPVRRTGLVHAATNATALTLYSASLAVRRRGNRRQGVLLGLAGATALGAGGYLGAHLSYSAGIGPDQTVFDPGPLDWTPAGSDAPLPERRPTRVVADETPVLLFRDGEATYAIHDRCSHRGCSLSDGKVDGHHIECACHGSRFDLRDGALVRGPATAPQPSFELRQRDGALEVRRRPSAG